ncbi:hypothetical protein CHS0354_026603, partial [Potamilus streckersoni]
MIVYDGIDDDSYKSVFKPVITKVMEKYRDAFAIVMQCGADSLSGDRLGCFNLTLKGHRKCVEFMTKWNLPMLLLEGGGYNKRNVARCWTYETSLVLGTELANKLPYKDYYGYEDYLCSRPPASSSLSENFSQQWIHLSLFVIENLSSGLSLSSSSLSPFMASSGNVLHLDT